MIDNKKVIAIIPARGGSKRLPQKNILNICGKPLIAWTIEAAKSSKYVDKVFVSTDDCEIRDISQNHGAEVPELRPHHLASDSATTESVVFYTLDKFAGSADIAIVLQPTSPLRTSVHIDESLEMLVDKDAYSVVSVTPCEHPPLWANILSEDGSMCDFLRPAAFKRSQDLDDYYRINGAIYSFDIRKLRGLGSIAYTSSTFAYVMCNKVSVDIDNMTDFEYAEFLLSRN